ncbi:MAG: diguanylate cyclase [Sulfurisoma sp.]|nr:diguanylate cyclase [Sulfurisoma sp.]
MTKMNSNSAEFFRDIGPFLGERYRWLVVGVYAVVATIFAGVASLEIAQIERHLDVVARERGAALFRLIELTRDWNSGHGGVYVPVTEATQPNPYLIDARRDIVSAEGMKLTRITPASMTRQIADLAEKSDGVRMHITSLKPIHPANKADPWEAESLALFETGLKERISFFGQETKPVHRYMAPLLVKPPCMKCHAQQDYRVGQVRGGISVTMPASELLAVGAAQRAWTLSLAIGTCLVVSLLGHLALDRARRYYVGLSDLTRKQDRIIAERTREVEARNADLQREVEERTLGQRRLAESESRYRSVIESSQDGVVVLDQGNIVFVNERLTDILGFRPEDALGHPFIEFVAESDRAWVAERHQRRMRGEVVVPGGARIRLRHHNPKLTRIADILIVPLREGTHGQWVVTVKDITLQVRNERELEIAAAVFDHAAEGIIVTDRENRILRVNPAFTSITGYTPGEAIGQTPDFLKSGRHDAAFYQAMWQALAERGHWEGEIWNRHKNGNLYVQWLAIATVPDEGDAAGRYVATFTDITQRKHAEELLRHKAQHDPLTDLPNRALFQDRLDGALASSRRYGRQFGLLALDLDRFKEVNDSLGHQAGDEVLIEVAKRLLSCVREADTVARLGGDEFTILLTEVGGAAEIEQVGRRALELLAQPFHLAAGTATLSGSIGMVLYPEHGEDAETLQRLADRTLYAVKAGGRNGCRFYSEGL